MTEKVLKKPKANNPYLESAQRIRQLAQILAHDPDEAQAFRVKTGIFSENGELKPPYR